MSRSIALAGPLNFRDLGGYRTADGRQVKWRHVYRSDSLHHLTPEDGRRLANLGIVSALDFRDDDELGRIGIGHLGELAIHHVHLPTEDKTRQSQQGAEWQLVKTAVQAYLYMLDYGAPTYGTALKLLAEPGTLPAVYFCMAGKDRSGIFSAVLLGLLGVSDDDVVADYALTHRVLDAMRIRSKDQDPDGAQAWDDLPPDMIGAHPESMQGAIAGMRERWGGFEGWAAFAGVEGKVIDRLGDALLGDANGSGLNEPGPEH
jgi:protein-tyrosine phosphatase